MNCPFCACELRLGEPVPAALKGAFVYVRCAEAACAREMVAAMPTKPANSSEEPRLMPSRAAFRERRRLIGGKRNADRIVTILMAFGSVFGGIGFAWAVALDGGPDMSPGVPFLCAGTGVVGALVLGGGFYLDTMLGAERWLQDLPRVQLSLVGPPKAYRL